jgi:regulator of RNase E activity RraA
MPRWNSDAELFEIVEKELRTALLCDAMDGLGRLNQAMEECIRPMKPQPERVIAGRAATALFVDVHYRRANPYEFEIPYVDALEPGDIAVVASNRSRSNGIWGELMSTAAKCRGAKATVTDGICRDFRQIVELDYPVYCAGLKPQDSAPRGMMTEHSVPVRCGGVLVNPGDLIVMDIDGVCVVPRAIEAETIIAAINRATCESHSKKELLAGALLCDVYARHGVL